MDFKAFYEFADQLDTDKIFFQPHPGGGYYYDFTIDADTFSVMFTPRDIRVYHTYNNVPQNITLVPKSEAFEISFAKNGSMAQSNEGNAFKIYTKVFAVIKHFLDTMPLKGIYFHGDNAAMDLVYDKFYRKYLVNKFLKIDYSNYVLISYFNSLSPEIQDFLKSYMEKSINPKNLPAIKKTKLQDMQNRRDPRFN